MRKTCQMTQEQNTPPTILLIEEDDDTRPLLRHNLKSQGYRPIVALDEEDALQRMDGRHDDPDLILINQFDRLIEEVLNMGRRIRQDRGLPSCTPIVVIAERYGEDMEGQDVQVGESEYVTYLEDAQQLMNLLQRLCPV